MGLDLELRLYRVVFYETWFGRLWGLLPESGFETIPHGFTVFGCLKYTRFEQNPNGRG